MSFLLEPVVDTPAIMDECTRPIRPQQPLGDFSTATANLVTGCAGGDEGVQPGTPAPHAPTSFIRHDPDRLTDGKPQLLVRRSGPRRGAQQAAGTGGARESYAEDIAEEVPTL